MGNQLYLFRPDEIALQLGSKVIYQKRPTYRQFKVPKSKQTPYGSRSYSQRAYFHASYKKLSPSGQIATKKHLSYIMRNGTGIDGKTPTLFGSVSKEEILDFKKNEKYQFRFRLSPENGTEIDMEKFTKKFMELIQKETGLQYRWVAACHYNTEHPHAHIMVSGVDIAGKKIRFERYQLARRFRDLAQKELTFMLGYRKTQEIENELNKVRELRVTRVDNIMKGVIDHEHTLSRSTINKCFNSYEKTLVNKRLEFLKNLGLARRTETGFKFSPQWFQKLKDLGRCESFPYAAKALKYTHKTQLEYYQHEKGKITGRLSWNGMKNEMSDARAIAIETLDGRAVYCPCGPAADYFKVGDTISFDGTQKPFKQISKLSHLQLQRQLQNTNNIRGFGNVVQQQLTRGGLEY